MKKSEVVETFFRASGNGGQNRNRRDTAVRLHHKPTGITVTASRERSQHQNRRAAWEELQRRIAKFYHVPEERIDTEPTRSSVRKRLVNKRRNADKKVARRKVHKED